MTRCLLLILVLSALISVGFVVATPMGAAPDEGAHLRYVQVLLDERRLPQLDLAHRRANRHADADYEGHQPPLYYAIAVPFYAVGRAIGGNPGGGYGARLLSVLLGLLGTWLVWLIARAVAPTRPGLWIAATGFAAFLPMRLAVNSAGGNDPLAEVTASLVLLLLARGIHGQWGVKQAALTGLALGLALLSKAHGILLLPAALLGVYLACRPALAEPAAAGKVEKGGKKRAAPVAAPAPVFPVALFLKTGLIVLGVALLVSGWWFARNHVLYGDPLGQRMFNEYFADTTGWEYFRTRGYSYGDYWQKLVFPTLLASFWGAFGHLDPNKPQLFMGAYGEGPPGPRWGYPPQSWLYPGLGLTLVASLAGWGRYYWYWKRSVGVAAGPANPGVGVAGVLAVHLACVGAAFLNFNSTFFQAQGRYLFPAIAAIALAVTGGWLSLVSRFSPASPGVGEERVPVAAWVVCGGMLLLACYALFGVVIPGFAP